MPCPTNRVTCIGCRKTVPSCVCTDALGYPLTREPLLVEEYLAQADALARVGRTVGR